MDEPGDLPRWWTQYGTEYESRSWRDYRHLLADAVRYAPAPPLVDVGCGYGFLVECARQFGVPAVGLEASEHALAECRRRHPLCDVRQWVAGSPVPVASASVGVVVLNQVIDHFTMEENRLLFAEACRILRDDGTLLAYSPSRHNAAEQDTGHVTFFSPAEFRQFVETFGLRVQVQPYHLQPVLGGSRPARLLIRALTEVYRPDRWAATIDLVACKSKPSVSTAPRTR